MKTEHLLAIVLVKNTRLTRKSLKNTTAAIAKNATTIAAAVKNCNEYIASQVLATSLVLVDGLVNGTILEMDGYNVNCIIEKA